MSKINDITAKSDPPREGLGLVELLRLIRLAHRFGLTPAQATTVAGLAWGAAE